MLNQPIRDEVMRRALRLEEECHPAVAERHADELARYARLTSACDALESFNGLRPSADEDAFYLLAQRRSQIADMLAQANLEAFEQEAESGIYLAIPYFARCADSTPSGHPVRSHLARHSTAIWPPVPRPSGRAVGAQRRRGCIVSLRCPVSSISSSVCASTHP